MSFKYRMTGKLFITVFFVISVFCAFATSYTCDTPDEWLSGDSGVQHSIKQITEDSASGNLQISRGQLWPNGVVKYKFNHTLTLNDMSEIRKAFDEFHSKTCIRFVPWKEGDVDFVSIEVDNSVCGRANVCKLGGYQYARFGGICRNMATMVHELGHVICLAHEHQRADRDDYINFQNCNNRPEKLKKSHHAGIYDFASQMHYQCNSCDGGWPNDENVNRCGPDFTTGLSVLDVDTINALYNCQGCQRHRWISTKSLTHKDKANMFNFGYEAKDGTPLHLCRAMADHELTPGIYDESKQSCNITIGFGSRDITNNVEVLTIPGGPNAQCSIYKLVKSAEAFPINFVPVGSLLKVPGWSLHPAYASRTRENGVVEKAVGKIIWKPNENKYWEQAELRIGSETYTTPGDYDVLTCSLDSKCLAEEFYRKKSICDP